MITKEKMEEIFNECGKIFKKINTMNKRQMTAQKNIKILQEEMAKLKAQRPALLADGKDVTKINKRLKKIEEEIELSEDLIKGIIAKKKNLDDTIYQTKIKRQEAFKNYVKGIMNKVAMDYNEIAPKFAELVREYLVLEYMYYGSDRAYVSAICQYDIRRIPSISDNNPLFEYKLYDLYINYNNDVRKKYDIPEFEVHRIRR